MMIEFPHSKALDEIERVRGALRQNSADSDYIAGVVAALRWMLSGGEPPSTKLIQMNARAIPGGRG